MLSFEITAEGRRQGITQDFIGSLPTMASVDDPRPARKQFDENYISGWRPYRGFTMSDNGTLSAPDDPDMKPLAIGWFRNELIYVYEFSWVAIVQPDKSFEVARMN